MKFAFLRPILSLAVMAAAGCSPGPVTPEGTPPTSAVGIAAVSPGIGLTLDAGATTWQPLLLADLAAFQVPAPPAEGSPELLAERAAQAARPALTAAQAASVKAWGSVSAPVMWDDMLRERLRFYKDQYYPPRSARAFAAMNVAVYDALLVAWQAKAAYRRGGPGASQPTYPCEDATVAYAAATMIGYLIPQEKDAMLAQARAATDARLLAGANLPSDIAAGQALGTAVAEAVIAKCRQDGVDGTPHTGPVPPHHPGGTWTHIYPQEPLAGAWKPWLLTSGAQLRGAEPPRPGSPAFQGELAEVLAVWRTLTDLQKQKATEWAYASPPAEWNRLAVARITKQQFSPVRAARTLAYLNMIEADAAIACWDSKYHWNQLRPEAVADPKTGFEPWLVRAPSHPSYPSGHSAFSGGASAFLSAVFPEDAQTFQAYMKESSESRIYGGIHFRADLIEGERLGDEIAKIALLKWQLDGK